MLRDYHAANGLRTYQWMREECDTRTSSQRRSDGNIEPVRFLDSHEGDGARAVVTGVQLLYKNNFPNDPPSKFTHR